MNHASLVVLISGNGSNLQAVLDACKNGTLPAEVSAVISNTYDAFGLERARKADVPALVEPYYKGQDRRTYDDGLADLVSAYKPDLIILAGWMRVLSMAFLGRFPNRVINLHPALPGTFPGVNAIERAYQAYQNHEIDHTGVMVHFVPDEGVDIGPIIQQQSVLIRPGDRLEDLEKRVHALEHELLVKSIKQVLSQLEEGHA